jgi:uncharacterized protein involved in exopolysaccharide biosynthesis
MLTLRNFLLVINVVLLSQAIANAGGVAEIGNSQRVHVAQLYQPGQSLTDFDLAESSTDSDWVALNNALQAVVAERIHAQEMWEQANNSKEIGLPQILEDGAIKALRTQRAALMADYQNKLSTFEPDHPDMLRLKAQMNQIDQEIKSEADVIKQSLKAHYESALQQEVLLKNKMEGVKRGVLETRSKEIQYNILKREAHTNRTLYDGLLQQYKDIGVAGAVGTNNVAVIDRAQVPGGPYKPNLRSNLVRWLGFGLVAAALAIALAELLDHTFKSPEEIEEQLGLVLKYRWLVLASCAVGLAIGFFVTFTSTPIYQATVTIQIDRQAARVVKVDGAYDPNSGIDNTRFYQTQYDLLRSRPLAERVVTDLDLAAASDFLYPPSSSAWRKLRSLILPSANTSTATVGKQEVGNLEQRKAAAASMVQGGLSVDPEKDSNLVRISFESPSGEWAARIANGVADAYVVDQLDARLEAAKRASGWLSDRITELRQQLRDSEEAVAKFRKEHGLTRSGPTVALNEQQLAELNGKLIAARTDAAEKKARVDFIADLVAGKKTLDSLPDSLQSSSSMMSALRQKLADASQREADLLARYNRSHPAVVNVEAEKRDIERTIAVETQRMAESVKSDYALAKARLDAIQRAMDEATGQGVSDNEVAVRLRELERTAAVNKTLFEEFLQKAKVTDEQSHRPL